MNKDSKDGEKPLPAGWVLCQSKNSGRTYYFNRKTGKSLWTQPQAEEKSRSPVQNKLEKPRIEEPEKKNLKRKSDSRHEDTSPKKKTGRETPTATPEKPKASTPAFVKNSASKRLQQLRKQLTQEANRDEQTTEKNQTKSPVKYKPDERRQSPKVNHPDTPTKSKPVDLKSPVQSSLTDSRCSTNTQSPSSDSLQSIPSPSQFFAANKILSSMKAQLPDEYCITTKSKDTFADIDEAICSQILEYPSTKHPSTPPQFSEASKIVSAIKSKLEYKSLADNLNSTEVKVYNSASDRMKALRTSLSKEASGEISELNSSFVNNECKTALKRKPDEAMEIEVCREKVSRVNPPCTSSTTNNIMENTEENLVIVIDTNIFIHELDVIKNVVNSHVKGYAQQPTLLVPWRVINELDRLKDNNNGNGAICKRARSAMDYLYQSLPENKRIKGQSLRDANSHIYPCEIPDDEILNCCLQQAERGNSVILITNDKNLCSKAIINAVKSITLGELKTMMVNKPQEGADPDLQATMKRYENSIYQLLANILENEMRAKYNTLWQHVLFKAPPWSLRDVLQCLLKHWIAVFSEVFPRIEHLITELKNALITAQDRGDSLTQSQVNNFKDLSLEVARKCQIIPEYLELAKLTVERISRREPLELRCDEMPVIEAFEQVWTVLSSYCAKLSSGLGITHSIEDKLIGEEPLTALTGKFRVFSEQIHNFTDTIKGVLNVSSDTDPALNSLTRCLESVFKDCLHLISADSSAVSRDSLKLFCTKCRNMLQEAYTKFAHLTELLEMCQNVMND